MCYCCFCCQLTKTQEYILSRKTNFPMVFKTTVIVIVWWCYGTIWKEWGLGLDRWCPYKPWRMQYKVPQKMWQIGPSPPYWFEKLSNAGGFLSDLWPLSVTCLAACTNGISMIAYSFHSWIMWGCPVLVTHLVSRSLRVLYVCCLFCVPLLCMSYIIYHLAYFLSQLGPTIKIYSGS